MAEDLDTTVKLAVYRITAESGAVPMSADIALATNIAEDDVRAAFARLHAKRLLVPGPGNPSRIRMAPPFSGIPTAFPVEALVDNQNRHLKPGSFPHLMVFPVNL